MNISLNIKLTVFAVLSVSISLAQSIRGKVLDIDNLPLPGVSIIVTSEGVSMGGVTDLNGVYNIKLDKKGSYDVEFSFLGFKSEKRNIFVNGEVKLASLILHESTEQLQEVEIIGRKRVDYNSDYSFSATKIAMKTIELPQSVGSVTKELIKDRQAYQISEAVKGVSGVSPTSFYNHFNIRGITQNQDGQIVNGMRTSQKYFLQPITQNIERIEVLKGPGSVTFSSADPGGSINMVTKKPLKENKKEVSFGVGSFSTIRGGLDLTGPLNDKKTILYRLNIGVQQAKSFRDLVKNNAFLISPSFSYVPNKNTAVNVELIYTDNTGNLDRGQSAFGQEELKKKDDFLKTPIKTNIGAENDYANYKELILTTSLSQKILDNLTFNAQYMKQTFNDDVKQHRAFGFMQDVNNRKINSLVRLRYLEEKQFWETDNISAYFTYNLKFSDHKSTFIFGYDLHSFDKPTGNGLNQSKGYYKGESIDYNGLKIKKSFAGFYDLENPSNIIRNTQSYPLTSTIIPTHLLTTNGAYIQNVTKIGKASLLFSLRHEWFKDNFQYGTKNEKTYRHKALIPSIGLSYEISNNINIYSTYLEGFQPNAYTTNVMPVNATKFYNKSPSEYNPMRSNLIEFGAKANLLKGALKVSTAVFQIQQKDILLSEEDASGTTIGYNQRGEDRSRGFEFDFSGYIIPELQVYGSYSYIEAIILKDTRKELEGARKEATPKNSANLWMKYNFRKIEILKDFSLGLGVQYSGDKIGWYDRSIELPAYMVADAILYYQPKQSDLEFNLKVNNIFNEVYWTGSISKSRLFPGTPRNIMFTTTYRF